MLEVIRFAGLIFVVFERAVIWAGFCLNWTQGILKKEKHGFCSVCVQFPAHMFLRAWDCSLVGDILLNI